VIIVTMTIYTPLIEGRAGPKYRIIADAIGDDIQGGALTVGAKLPTHRDLAYRLGVTVGTVTRAYAELHHRGYTGGKVGSGTYVANPEQHRGSAPFYLDAAREVLTRSDKRLTLAQPDDGNIDLAMNRPPPGPEAQALAHTLAELSQSEGLAALTQYTPAPGMNHHRAAVAELLKGVGLNADPEDIVMTSGAQHATAACALGILKAGDVVLTERLTYPGTTSLMAHRGAKVFPVDMDEFGILPDALEAAVRETGARVAYVMPVHQNPTTAVMNMERLAAVAAIAKRYDLIIIEDDVYGFQPERRNPPLACLAPEHVIYINGFAKSISPGLRVGFLKSPKSLFPALARAAQITGWMIPPLMGEIATRWINSGTAQDIINWHRAEMIARNRLAADILQGFDFAAKPESLHMWLDLPSDHSADTAIRELNQRGVILAGPESFTTTQSAVPRALRLCLGSPPSREHLRQALTHVRNVLISEPAQDQHMIGAMVM